MNKQTICNDKKEDIVELAIEKSKLEYIEKEELQKVLQDNQEKHQPVLDFLKDK